MPFIAKNRVRMHDTDMAGILYFARQFRFVHDTFEDFILDEGHNLKELFRKELHLFVIVHAESDYYHSVTVGDELEVHLSVEKIGTTSFTLAYKIFVIPEKTLIGTAKTVHVCIDKNTRGKHPIPKGFIPSLEKYINDN